MKRKRKSAKASLAKKPKVDQPADDSGPRQSAEVQHPVLECYYKRVYTLRDYLHGRLSEDPRTYEHAINRLFSPKDGDDTASESLAQDQFDAFLASVLVGVNAFSDSKTKERRSQDLVAFSQHVPESTVGCDSLPDARLQLEVVNFVIWVLFRRQAASRPQHLLCQGFERAAAAGHNGLNLSHAPGIPGVICHYPNDHVETVTNQNWCRLLSLLGRGGDLIMVDLLLDSGIFIPLKSGNGNLYQLSGLPLSTVAVTAPIARCDEHVKPVLDKVGRVAAKSESSILSEPRKASEIRFVRNRMYYARPALNGYGSVRLGLRHIHVFNRFADVNNDGHTIHILKYIFPHEFKLHNVFTSVIDSRETTQPLKDYTLREHEISVSVSQSSTHLPKRLRGPPVELIRKIRKAHSKLPYVELLRYHCPIRLDTKADRVSPPLSGPPELEQRDIHQEQSLPNGNTELRNLDSSQIEVRNGQGPKEHDPTVLLSSPESQQSSIPSEKYLVNELENREVTAQASSSSAVSAFVRSVLNRLIPNEAWGTGEAGKNNSSWFLQSVDRFIHRRKFESLTLQEVLQGLKVSEMEWLSPPGGHTKMARSDFEKRKQLLAEFIYYLIDSFVIPLIRSNFHVTESNGGKNRLFYFRHDVWRQLTEPSISELKQSIFQDIGSKTAKTLLSGRSLGYSQIRMLPKKTDFRPIANLRRRPEYLHYGKRFLGKSVNSTLNPAFKVLNYEKDRHRSVLGSSLFSVSGIHTALKEYRDQLKEHQLLNSSRYFVKVDVKSCFDTIPQRKVLEIVSSIVSAGKYAITSHAEVRPPQIIARRKGAAAVKPRVRFQTEGHSAKKVVRVEREAEQKLGQNRKDTVFIGSIGQQIKTKDAVLSLLTEHVERNTVKIGKKFYRQKNGIPQGSVVSSLLCNLFYGKLESEDLSFIKTPGTVLLRLIDDFLLISTDKEIAMRFLHVMHNGIPEYGIAVKPEKSLTNFPASINDHGIQAISQRAFPYCGILIDTLDFNITKDMTRAGPEGIPNSLTVENSIIPGKTFRQKALNGLRIQMHAMFFDTTFNSLKTVMKNVYMTFYTAALRLYHYMRSLTAANQPSAKLIIRTIEDMMTLAYTSVRRRWTRARVLSGYDCCVRKGQVRWLACKACHRVFHARQTAYSEVVDWLVGEVTAAWPSKRRSEMAALRLGVAEER